ncbi:hypothetical protein TorRG33x02_135690 [Trema orientale]|uniref:Uncharacterized protein n=1 Tax=Trema orientale TaxID=63057 RepID=A0A2P5EYV5_TREOI|nr:hypothetical protein TorRG33x02_135690 [Trema orientale]
MVEPCKRKTCEESMSDLAFMRRHSEKLKSKVDDDDIEKTTAAASKFMSIITDDLLLEILVRPLVSDSLSNLALSANVGFLLSILSFIANSSNITNTNVI